MIIFKLEDLTGSKYSEQEEMEQDSLGVLGRNLQMTPVPHCYQQWLAVQKEISVK